MHSHQPPNCPQAKAGMGLCPKCTEAVTSLTEAERECQIEVTDEELGRTGPLNRKIRGLVDGLF